MIYNDTVGIRTLYHGVSDETMEAFVLKNGIVTDSHGFIYLSEKPGIFPINFEVTIPDSRNLVDWREVWYDDNGEESDIDHQYDDTNPFYIYLSPIPREYVKLLPEAGSTPMKLESVLKEF